MVDGAEIDQLFVAPAARGCGLAGRLLADGEARIRAAGHDPAFLHCAIGNLRARRFHERSGWRVVGEAWPDEVAAMVGATRPISWRMEKALR